MFRRRVLMTLVIATSFFVVQALPAQAADLRKTKSFSFNGRTGKVSWYTEKSGGDVINWVNVTNEDSDDGGKCTEVWWDYATKPHLHFNPGLYINCSGDTRTRSKIHVANYYGIAGFQVVVCEVPNTSGSISRSSKNCAGNLDGIYLRSGQRYSRFGVSAMRYPSGIKIYR